MDATHILLSTDDVYDQYDIDRAIHSLGFERAERVLASSSSVHPRLTARLAEIRRMRAIGQQAPVGVRLPLQARRDAAAAANDTGNAVEHDGDEVTIEQNVEQNDGMETNRFHAQMVRRGETSGFITRQQQRRQRQREEANEQAANHEAERRRTIEEAARLEERTRRSQEMTLEQRLDFSKQELANKFLETRMRRMGETRAENVREEREEADAHGVEDWCSMSPMQH